PNTPVTTPKDSALTRSMLSSTSRSRSLSSSIMATPPSHVVQQPSQVRAPRAAAEELHVGVSRAVAEVREHPTRHVSSHGGIGAAHQAAGEGHVIAGEVLAQETEVWTHDRAPLQ